MKKALKIIGIVLLVIVIAAGAALAMNWKYVRALIDGITMDETKLGQQRVENTSSALDKMDSYMDAEIRPLTEEEKEQIEAGLLSQTEVMAQIIADATGIELTQPDVGDTDAAEAGDSPSAPDAPSGAGQTGQNGQSGQSGQTGAGQSGQTGQSKPAASSSDQLVAACVNKLYGLQAQYTAQLDGLAARAIAYYHEQKAAGSASAKSSTISKFGGEVASMEDSCDAKVEAALSELSSGLKAIGADTSIVGELRGAYNKEKSNQRAAYVNRYLK